MTANGRGWWIAAIAAAALLACYAPVIAGIAGQWWNDEDMSHGFVVPLCIAWIVWRERRRWLALTRRPNAWGFALLLAGAALHAASAGGAGLFAGALALVASSAGAVLLLAGTAYLRAWAFPIALTAFMLPKLALVYNQATLPLQLAATRLAAGMLRIAGLVVAVDGNILHVAGQAVAVEEACNGLRFLLSLGLLAVMFAWYFDPKPWMRWALLAGVAPAAVGANALRVAGDAWLASFHPKFAEGPFHVISGVVIFVACLPVLVLLNRLINRVYERWHEV